MVHSNRGLQDIIHLNVVIRTPSITITLKWRVLKCAGIA